MHTVELLKHALAVAERLGYRIRQDWLDGSTGGACLIGNQKWIFLDLTLGPLDHLTCVAEAIRGEPRLVNLDLPPELRSLLDVRKSA